MEPDEEAEARRVLAESLHSGSPEALAEAYRRWSRLIYTIAVRALESAEDAEDITQQVFLAAWTGRHTLRPAADALPSWLVGIARHRIADAIAQRYRGRRTIAAVAGQPDPALAETAEALLLAHEVAALPEPRRTVLTLAYLHDCSHDEIARRLAIPVGTVKSHLARGLLQLRRRLEGGE
jgi:RNA polymerase sigma factor (sigma-70 family)